MDIFNVQIFGDDALDFCSWSKSEQKEWIKKYTNQQSEAVIDEFLNNPLKNEQGKCMNCGTLNNIIVRHEQNFSKNNVNEVATNSNGNVVKESGSGDSTERPKSVKRRKN